jgi:hypothetical protein
MAALLLQVSDHGISPSYGQSTRRPASRSQAAQSHPRPCQRLGHLQRLLESQLQPAAREHCHVASWREGSLLLIVTDGHWATRLRYQQKRLQRQLQMFDEFASLTRILFKVQPPTVQQGAAGHTMDLSNDAAATIQATADGISDPACGPRWNDWRRTPGPRVDKTNVGASLLPPFYALTQISGVCCRQAMIPSTRAPVAPNWFAAWRIADFSACPAAVPRIRRPVR